MRLQVEQDAKLLDIKIQHEKTSILLHPIIPLTYGIAHNLTSQTSLDRQQNNSRHDEDLFIHIIDYWLRGITTSILGIFAISSTIFHN